MIGNEGDIDVVIEIEEFDSSHWSNSAGWGVATLAGKCSKSEMFEMAYK